MILLVGFYIDANAARTEEFLECLRRNASNEHIENISLFLEEPISSVKAQTQFPALRHPKVQLVSHGCRLTYSHLLEYANRHFPGAGVIISNADIFFDETLALLDEEPLTGRMLCLSRWDQASDGTFRHLDRPDSQDVWIFETPVPPIAGSFCLGKPGCDNRLAYEAERAGLLVLNPSRSVRARHLHNTASRRYTERERLNGPIRLVPASFLEVPPASSKLRDTPMNGFPSHRGFRTMCLVNERYHEVEALLRSHLGGVMPRGLRRELLRAVSNRTPGPVRPTAAPLAAIGFRETMGYTLARFECGVSTHNNDPRPLISVPAELAGLVFTQVVANRATPVEIEFRTEGRLFILAAPGWEGYAPAMDFLDEAGWREPIEPLRTGCGTIFEPWSLAAKAGERLVIPTQVMLAAAELIPMG